LHIYTRICIREGVKKGEREREREREREFSGIANIADQALLLLPKELQRNH